MAATLALVAAFLFALAAALQQKGALNLPTISLADPKSLVRLVGQRTWLLGTLALFADTSSRPARSTAAVSRSSSRCSSRPSSSRCRWATS